MEISTPTFRRKRLNNSKLKSNFGSDIHQKRNVDAPELGEDSSAS